MPGRARRFLGGSSPSLQEEGRKEGREGEGEGNVREDGQMTSICIYVPLSYFYPVRRMNLDKKVLC